MNKVMNLRVPQDAGRNVTSSGTISFSRSGLLHGVRSATAVTVTAESSAKRQRINKNKINPPVTGVLGVPGIYGVQGVPRIYGVQGSQVFTGYLESQVFTGYWGPTYLRVQGSQVFTGYWGSHVFTGYWGPTYLRGTGGSHVFMGYWGVPHTYGVLGVKRSMCEDDQSATSTAV